MSHTITGIISAIAPIYDPVIDWFLGGETRVRKRMAEKVGDFQRGLDIGCGTGTFLSFLSGRNSELYGTDISKRMLKVAGRKHMDAEFIRGSALALPFKDASFDAVFSTMMMHHLTHSEREKAIAEVRRVLTPGGTYYSVEFGDEGLDRIGKAVTGLGFLEDRELKGFEMAEKGRWEKGLVWRKLHRK